MALDCKTIKGVAKQCRMGVGGVKYLGVLLFSALNQATIASCKETGKIDADAFDDLCVPTAAGVSAYVWECVKDTIVGGSELVRNNNQPGFNHSIGATWQGTPVIGDDAVNLVLSDLCFIARDNMGAIRLYGADNGMQMETFAPTTGTSQQDLNGTPWTATGYQISMPLEFDGVTWEDIVAKTWKTT